MLHFIFNFRYILIIHYLLIFLGLNIPIIHKIIESTYDAITDFVIQEITIGNNTKQNNIQSFILNVISLIFEVMMGIEPTTKSFRDSHSTIELHYHLIRKT